MSRAFHAGLLALSLIGCAPLASFRPTSSLGDGRRFELGAGGIALSPRPYVIEPWRTAGQVWFSARASRTVVLSAISGFDDEALALGGAMRLEVLKVDRFVGSLEGELGWAWTAVSVPLALRLVDDTWLYATPRFGNWGDDPSFGIPVGMSLGLLGPISIRFEAQASWSDLRYFNRRFHAGLAAAAQW